MKTRKWSTTQTFRDNNILETYEMGVKRNMIISSRFRITAILLWTLNNFFFLFYVLLDFDEINFCGFMSIRVWTFNYSYTKEIRLGHTIVLSATFFILPTWGVNKTLNLLFLHDFPTFLCTILRNKIETNNAITKVYYRVKRFLFNWYISCIWNATRNVYSAILLLRKCF